MNGCREEKCKPLRKTDPKKKGCWGREWEEENGIHASSCNPKVKLAIYVRLGLLRSFSKDDGDGDGNKNGEKKQ